jgi:hypothetical protein
LSISDRELSLNNNLDEIVSAENRLLVKYLLEQKPNTALSFHVGDFNRDAVLVSLKEKICGVG